MSDPVLILAAHLRAEYEKDYDAAYVPQDVLEDEAREHFAALEAQGFRIVGPEPTEKMCHALDWAAKPDAATLLRAAITAAPTYGDKK